MIGRAKARYFFGLISLPTGAALLVYFLAGVSLRLSICATVALALGSATLVWLRLSVAVRREILRRTQAGLLAGLLATAGYDLSRYVFVKLADLSIPPFETLWLFGCLLAGPEVNRATQLVVGSAFHLSNGISFAISYTLLFGYHGWKAGVAWAMGLELLMVSFYPGWLNLRALDEFLSVTISGHVVYGWLLGWGSRALLQKVRERP